MLFLLAVNAQEKFPAYEKRVESKRVKVICVGDVRDHLILSIKIKEKNLTHEFLIMKGLDFETCVMMRNKVKDILKSNREVYLVGFEGLYYKDEMRVVYDWKLIRSKKQCVSYMVNYCQ